MPTQFLLPLPASSAVCISSGARGLLLPSPTWGLRMRPLSTCQSPHIWWTGPLFSFWRLLSTRGSQQRQGRKKATYPHTWGSTAVAPSQAASSGGADIGGGNTSHGRSARDAWSGLVPKNHCLPSAGVLSPSSHPNCRTTLCLKPLHNRTQPKLKRALSRRRPLGGSH